jgi:hypothetical protein
MSCGFDVGAYVAEEYRRREHERAEGQAQVELEWQRHAAEALAVTTAARALTEKAELRRVPWTVRIACALGLALGLVFALGGAAILTVLGRGLAKESESPDEFTIGAYIFAAIPGGFAVCLGAMGVLLLMATCGLFFRIEIARRALMWLAGLSACAGLIVCELTFLRMHLASWESDPALKARALIPVVVAALGLVACLVCCGCAGAPSAKEYCSARPPAAGVAGVP